MTAKHTTIETFCKELDIHFIIIKYYCKTFNINLFDKSFLVKKEGLWLNQSDVVTQKFINFFLARKDELIEYNKDYFSTRTIEDIALKIHVDVEEVKHSITKSTFVVKDVSSYQILKDIQLKNRLKLIKNINNPNGAGVLHT